VEGDNVKYLKPRSRPQFSIQDSHKKDRAEGERLAKRIARCGVSSRRDAEELIRSGAVTVDGSIVTTPAINVQPGSVITVNGELVRALPPQWFPHPPPADFSVAQQIKAEKPRLLIYNKPAGVVVQNLRPGDVDRPEARSLGTILTELDLRSFKAVGRLDINTEGLLLLTNDGELKRCVQKSKFLTCPLPNLTMIDCRHLELPISELEREYRVRVFGEIDENKLAKLKDGVEIDGFQYRGCKVTVDKQKGANAWLTIMLKEGKNREIKVIMEALGLKVSRLIRVRFGPYELDPKDLPEGDIQEISISREHQRHTDPTWRWGEKDEEPQRFRARTAKSQGGGSDGPRRSRSPTREAAAPGNESGDKSWTSRP
jgi:23S rRNA pseudouridine2605 synthase